MSMCQREHLRGADISQAQKAPLWEKSGAGGRWWLRRDCRGSAERARGRGAGGEEGVWVRQEPAEWGKGRRPEDVVLGKASRDRAGFSWAKAEVAGHVNLGHKGACRATAVEGQERSGEAGSLTLRRVLAQPLDLPGQRACEPSRS